MNGQLLAGRYRTREVLGEGRAGTVLAAYDELLDRQVAVKVLDRICDGVGIRRALRAARSALPIASPHVIALLDLGEADPALLVMERLHARPLPAVLADGLPAHEARRIGDAVLTAVATLHTGGVVHRDVRAENVLITTGGRVALTPAGMAEAALDSALGVRFTAEPPRPAPAPSPEQARSLAADARSDVFALAVLLSALGRDVMSAAEAAVLHQAASVDPLQRHPSAESLRAELHRARRPARPIRRETPRPVASVAGPPGSRRPAGHRVADPPQGRRFGGVPAEPKPAPLVQPDAPDPVPRLRDDGQAPHGVAWQRLRKPPSGRIPAPRPDAGPARRKPRRSLRAAIGAVATASLLAGTFLAARGLAPVALHEPEAAAEPTLDGLRTQLARDPELVGPQGAGFVERLDHLDTLEGEERAREAADLVAVADMGKASGAFDPEFAEEAASVLAQEAASATTGASASAQNP